MKGTKAVTETKLSILYNFGQRYREPIFKAMDSLWDCKWFFGESCNDVRELDYSSLKDVKRLSTSYFTKNISWQHGALKVLKENNTHIILFGDLFCLSTWAILLLRPFVARNKRIILWSHGWYGREGIAKRLLKKVFFGLGDATFLYGEYAKSVAVKQGNRSDKLFVIHNSLDYDRQLKLRESAKKTDVYHSYFKNSDPTIIFVGRLTTEKRLEILIDALAKCRSMNHNYNLIFVGDGDKREYYEGIVKKYDIPVWFFGECYDEKKNAELIYNADLCVSPGNVGLTAMHTLMFGTPVITHDNPVNQMPEFEAIKSGLTGGFFSEGDVDDLAKKIVNWLSTVDRESIREACYKEIDTSWNPQFQIKVMESAL